MSDITEKAIDVTADAVAEVAHQAEGAEKAIRSLSSIKVQFGLLGAACGATVGALIAFKVAYSKAETKYNQFADDEIETMRRHYQAKMVALEATAAKEDLEDIVAEKGYASTDASPPMAVTPPTGVVEAAKEALQEQPPAAKVSKEPESRNIFKDAEAQDVEIHAEWDYHAEKTRRSPDIPYVIHYDERGEFADYTDMTLTYYEADDVLCNERDEIVPPEEREKLVGERNLERFGHGSNDANIVFIRNDSTELEIEVIKSPNSYAEEVHGFTHSANDRSNLERMRAREREQLGDDD